MAQGSSGPKKSGRSELFDAKRTWLAGNEVLCVFKSNPRRDKLDNAEGEI